MSQNKFFAVASVNTPMPVLHVSTVSNNAKLEFIPRNSAKLTKKNCENKRNFG